jgi:hypothetical protein
LQAGEQTDRKAGEQTDRKAGKQTRRTVRQTVERTDREENRQVDGKMIGRKRERLCVCHSMLVYILNLNLGKTISHMT